jgi:hypothetical protein
MWSHGSGPVQYLLPGLEIKQWHLEFIDKTKLLSITCFMKAIVCVGKFSTLAVPAGGGGGGGGKVRNDHHSRVSTIILGDKSLQYTEKCSVQHIIYAMHASLVYKY